jgi:hypothetical protein
LKLRLLFVGGAVAALSTISLTANAAGPGTGTCTTNAAPTPPAGAQTVALPDGGKAYAGGSPTAGGAVGSQGPHGWIQAGGSPSGGTIGGYSTDQGNLNGSLTVGSSPSVCVGVGGQKVSAP